MGGSPTVARSRQKDTSALWLSTCTKERSGCRVSLPLLKEVGANTNSNHWKVKFYKSLFWKFYADRLLIYILVSVYFERMVS